MQKIKLKTILLIFILIMGISNVSLASTEEILETQSETLNIKEFVNEANKYTNEAFSGIDVGNLLSDAIKGNIDNKTILSKIFNLFGKEVRETIKIIRKYSGDYCYT